MKKLLQILQEGIPAKKRLAILVDPDHFADRADFEDFVEILKKNKPDLIFIGGSLITSDHFKLCCKSLKEAQICPVVIFPGNNLQVSPFVDAILLLSLISGRNPEFLIGQHVHASHQLARTGIEIIPTSYMLINCGSVTAAQYMSNTTPIPHNKPSIASATALAGEQLGHQICYLDGGSGAEYCISPEMIKTIRSTIKTPIIVGGGINTALKAENIWNAGADVIVVGTAIEEKQSFLQPLIATRDKCSG